MKKQTPTTTHLKTEDGVLLYKEVPVSQMLAYPIPVAAALLGMGTTTFWLERKLGRIKTTGRGLVPKAELERYLADQVQS